MNAASWLRPVVLGGAVTLVLGLAGGCNEESTQPEDDSLVLPALPSPENVISAIQVIYNDKTHGKDERLAAYASLFDSAFVFYLQPADIAERGCRRAGGSWMSWRCTMACSVRRLLATSTRSSYE